LAFVLAIAVGVHCVGVTVAVSVIVKALGVKVAVSVCGDAARAAAVPVISSADKPVAGSPVACPLGRLQLTIASQMASIAERTLFLSIFSPYRRIIY
jgi:hypothetical protein